MPEVINIYSKSEHELGRLLSNFARTPFNFIGFTYQSVEGWWYWYTTGQRHMRLRNYYGWYAKKEGKLYPQTCTVEEETLKQVYLAKLKHNPHIKDMLLNFNGTFDHYYMYGDKKVPATKYLWTAKLWETIRDELRQENTYAY